MYYFDAQLYIDAYKFYVIILQHSFFVSEGKSYLLVKGWLWVWEFTSKNYQPGSQVFVGIEHYLS